MKKRAYKWFFHALVGGFFLFCAFNLIVWHFFTHPLLDDPACPPGDLTRLGYLAGSKSCGAQNPPPVAGTHLDLEQYKGQHVDVVNLGDSFSAGAAFGKTFYQDYIAADNGLTVLDIPQFRDIDKIRAISLLNNSGFFDRVKPKYVIIESSEKFCFSDFPDSIDFSETVPEEQLDKYERVHYRQQPATGRPPVISLPFFTEANVKLVRSALAYRFSPNGWGPIVYWAKLDRKFFSVPHGDLLLFHFKDVKGRNMFTEQNIVKLNGYLNTLSDRLAAKGIKLYYLPIVDKYNLYGEHLVNSRFPRSTFFEQLRPLPKRYGFIDTKAILQEEVQKGVQDIYCADDTHWTWKAPKKIFETVRFK